MLKKNLFPVLISGLALLSAFASEAAAQPVAPTNLIAYPAYGAIEIVVRWQDESADEAQFELERRTGGGAWAPLATPPAGPGLGPLEWRDNTIAVDILYSYRIRAVNADGASAWTGPTEDTQRPTNNFWPRQDGTHDIMNTWAGSASGNTWKFHEGVDVHAIEPVPVPPPVVQSIRGGRIATTAFGGPGLEISVQVDMGGGVSEWDYYLHLQDLTAKAVGAQIAPGEYLGRVSVTAYGSPRRHTHLMRMTANVLDDCTDCRSPWRFFSAVADQDPLGNNPHLLDQSGTPVTNAPDGLTILAVDAAAPGTVRNPARGDVDVLVEAYDDMNTTLAYENSLGAFAYWIEAHPPGGTGIGSVAVPLRLAEFDDDWFSGVVPVTPVFFAVFDNTRVHPGYATQRGHYIATNATTGTGDSADVDGTRFWRTKARTGAGTVPYYHDALLARWNGEARFPDGRYTVHALLSDQVHHDVEATGDLTVDNWLPLVVSVAAVHGADALSGATWSFDAVTGTMNASFPGGLIDLIQAGVPGTAIQFTITFSEPMDTATLNIPGVTWAPEAVVLAPNADRTVWTGTLAGGAPPGGTDPSGLYFLHIDGTDLAGNHNAGRTSFAAFDPSVVCDPLTGAPGVDTVHRFSIADQRDIVLLLDRSGSMGSPSPGFARKIDALRDAANIFLDILTPSSATDLAGVIYDNVIELLCGACGMGPAIAAHIENLRNGIATLAPRNTTSIGGGLIRAADELDGAGDEKNLVLLFTDGKHNTAPSVADGLTAIHALVPDNTTISAIGFGEGTSIDVPLLQSIVDSTEGQLWTTTSGLELHKFFIEALMNAGGTPYSVFVTDPVASIEAGRTAEHPFTISQDDRQVAIIVEWGNAAGTMNVSLNGPGDVVITRDTAALNPRVRVSGGTSYTVYQLAFPLAAEGGGPLADAWNGTWRIVVDAGGMTPGTHPYAYSVVSSSDLAVDARVVAGRFAGDKIYVVARLLLKGVPIAGRMSAQVDAPLVSTPNVMAGIRIPPGTLDAFKSRLRKEQRPDTPLTPSMIYAAAAEAKFPEQLKFPREQVTKPMLPGGKVAPGLKARETLKRSARTGAETLKGRLTPAGYTPGSGEYVLEVPNTRVAGDYRITVFASPTQGGPRSPLSVSFALGLKPRVDAAATRIEAVTGRDAYFLDPRKIAEMAVEVTPRDRFGNLLGAGLIEAGAMTAKADGATVEALADEGDGRYSMRLRVIDPRALLRIRLDVNGSPIRFTVAPDGKIKKEKA